MRLDDDDEAALWCVIMFNARPAAHDWGTRLGFSSDQRDQLAWSEPDSSELAGKSGDEFRVKVVTPSVSEWMMGTISTRFEALLFLGKM